LLPDLFCQKTPDHGGGYPEIVHLLLVMQPLTKQQIVGGFNRREPRAVSWICDKYQPGVFTIVRRLAGISPDTDDLVAEVFTRLMENPGRFPNLPRIKYFLFLTARNTCLNYIKRREMIRNRSGELEIRSPAFEEDQLEATEASAQLFQILEAAIEKLPPKCKAVFLLHYRYRLSNAAIAERLFLAEKTVANRKAQAMKLLKMDMKDKKSFIFLLNFFL
jgi:RNA polymerase sigma factor (sigma-70 family)